MGGSVSETANSDGCAAVGEAKGAKVVAFELITRRRALWRDLKLVFPTIDVSFG
jgi:hypothetical protein